MNNIFNEDEIDVLTEFINIGLGAAASNIAELLDAFATLHVPEIIVCNSDELIEILNTEVDNVLDYYCVKQLFNGKFGGELMFVMKSESAEELGNLLYGYSNASHDDIHDAVMELTNILTSTIVGKIAYELKTNVQFFVPSSEYISTKDIPHYEDIKTFSKIIAVKTILDFQEEKIKGYIFILTKDQCIESLKTLINEKIDELFQS